MSAFDPKRTVVPDSAGHYVPTHRGPRTHFAHHQSLMELIEAIVIVLRLVRKLTWK